MHPLVVCNAGQRDFWKMRIVHFIGIGIETELLCYFPQAVKVCSFCSDFPKFGKQCLDIIVTIIFEYHRQAGSAAFHHAALLNERK
jgi:hypothetical protein